MISKTYLRYIWLLDTIIGSRESLTYDHIVRMWKGSPYAYMGGLPIRTFHEHRKGIEEMFGVIIECDKSKGYTYYIKNPEVLKQNSYAQLLLRKYSVPQDFSTFNMMRNRILLEEIPHGTAYFDDVVEFEEHATNDIAIAATIPPLNTLLNFISFPSLFFLKNDYDYRDIHILLQYDFHYFYTFF